MRVALIVPPIRLEERYNKALANVTGSLPPLGLLSIATVLKRAGHDVVVLDGSVQGMYDILQGIKSLSPHIVGITSMTLMWPKVKILSKEIKKRWHNINVIVGGVHATLIKEKALYDISDIDAVCWGEGEFSMLEYVENLGSSNPIDGIAFRDKNGDLVIGKDRDVIKDIDILPIPERDFVAVTKYVPAIEQYKKLPVTNIFTTRGCSYMLELKEATLFTLL